MSNFHTFKLGNFTCTSLLDFAKDRTPRATFPQIDPVELQKEIDLGSYDLQLDTPMPLHGTVLFVDTGSQKILIDAGLPTAGGGQMITGLKEIGLSPDNIDMVIVTHGDGDHIGGLANYTQAKIVMPAHSHQLWTQDTAGMVEDFVMLFRESGTAEELSGMAAGRAEYVNVLEAIKNRIVLIEPGEAIIPGITFMHAPGHRRDHTAVEIRSGDSVLLHVADAWRHPLQLKRHDFYCLFDSYPDILADSMVMLLDHAAETGALVFGAHFNFPAVIKIAKDAYGYHWIDL
ncbi:MAG: glyoxylase-like metal-dependent hydrolase (beta-lactamase superfamily II) [Cellvibrionaceae bacterium]|jgi:glyoxylase-like metal-dependent hydrolase (beta-lactamase superfamily II)